MDFGRHFELKLEETDIAPVLKEKVVELTKKYGNRFLGSYGGENIYEISPKNQRNKKFQNASLEIILMQDLWTILGEPGRKISLTLGVDNKLYVEDNEAIWVVNYIPHLRVGLHFSTWQDCLVATQGSATPEWINTYMTGLNLNLFGERQDAKRV